MHSNTYFNTHLQYFYLQIYHIPTKKLLWWLTLCCQKQIVVNKASQVVMFIWIQSFRFLQVNYHHALSLSLFYCFLIADHKEYIGFFDSTHSGHEHQGKCSCIIQLNKIPFWFDCLHIFDALTLIIQDLLAVFPFSILSHSY